MFDQAQLPDPNHFSSVGWVVMILAGLMVMVRAGIGLVRDLKGKPEASEVQRESADKFTHRTDFDRLVNVNRDEHENLHRKIGGVERGVSERLEKRLTEIETRADESREKLHLRLNRMSIGVARLCGKLNVPMPAEDAEI